MNNEDALERFVETVGTVTAQVVHIANVEQLNAKLHNLLGDTATVYCPGDTELEQAVVIAPERQERDYIKADACVEEVFGAIAETGSLICSSKEGKTVQAGLLPSHHVAIVSTRNIYPTLNSFLDTCELSNMPTNITLETGPSRTADIELTLTVGVHGPERLSIVVVSN